MGAPLSKFSKNIFYIFYFFLQVFVDAMADGDGAAAMRWPIGSYAALR